MAVHNVILDLKGGISDDRPTLRLRQSERGSETINAAILDDGLEADLTGCAAIFNCITASGNVVSDGACTIEGNVITYTVSEYVTASAGVIRLAYFDLIKGGNYRDSTGGIIIEVDPSVTGSQTVPDNYFNSLDQALSQYYALIEGAKEQTANQAIAFAEAETERQNESDAAVKRATVATNEAYEVSAIAKILVDRALDSILWPNAKADMALAFHQIGTGCQCIDWLFLYHRLYCHTDAAVQDGLRIKVQGFTYDPETERLIQIKED